MPPDLIAHLHRHAEEQPERVALRDGDRQLNYAELSHRVTAMASALRHSGLKPQDRLVVWANKRLETVVALLAALAADIVIVPLHPALRAPQVQDIFNRAQAHGLLVDAPHATTLGFSQPLTGGLGFSPRPDQIPCALPEAEAIAHPLSLSNGDPDRLAALLYTSGSTGLPKGVMVTRQNLTAGAIAVSRYLDLNEQDELLAILPLSFDYGLSQLTTALTVGAGVTLRDYLLPNDLKKPLLEGGITVLAGTPGLLIPLARQAWFPDAPALRLITNSGGKLPVGTVRAMRMARPRTQIFLMYGLTEAFRASFLPPKEVDAHPESVGRGFDGSHLELVDATGRLLPAHEAGEGELVQGGPLVTAGYFNDTEATALRFRAPPAGWPHAEDERVVYSGDRVRRDAEGRLYFLGRTDEQIKSQGFRVSPEEVESVALHFDGVTEALAFGYQTDDEETRIGLVVAPETIAADALQSWLRARLAPFQMPATSLSVHALPRSYNGKLDRQASRALFLDRLAASSSTQDPSRNSGTLAP